MQGPNPKRKVRKSGGQRQQTSGEHLFEIIMAGKEALQVRGGGRGKEERRGGEERRREGERGEEEGEGYSEGRGRRVYSPDGDHLCALLYLFWV